MSFKRTGSTLAWIAVLALALSACGGSGSSSSSSTPTPPSGSGTTDCSAPTTSDSDGCTYVNLTDAPGDFLTYTVDVTALTLKRADGTVVNVLPQTTTVDFAQYSDLNEFLTLADMPLGSYVSGSITLDYSNADIEVQDSSGNAVKVSPVDVNGNPITTLSLQVQLSSSGELVLVPGVPKVFQLDFNLAASNVVDLTDDTVTVQPFLLASVDPNFDNQIRVRGPLDSVDTSDDSIKLGLRPFDVGSGNYGDMGILTNSNTVYNINQTPYQGSAGLTALAAAGADTAVVAKGSYDFDTHRFVAAEVDAGSSVPGGTMDAAEGVVLSRSGNAIVLRGATLYRTGQTATFRDDVAVTLGSGTKVHEEGSPKKSFDISDISVGQRLLVFGTLTDTNPSALALDATAGFAALRYTRFDGTVVTAPNGSGSNITMAVDVQYMEGRPVSMFDFTGTGSTSTDYVVSMPVMVNGIDVNDPVRLWGFVTPFGSAPPDFTETTVADYVDARSNLTVAWKRPGAVSAFSSLSASSGIIVNTATSPAPILARVGQGGIETSVPVSPTVKGGLGVFAILQNGVVTVHLDYATFTSDINSRLNAGAKVDLVFARGGYDGTDSTMQAADVAVIMD
ncbi:MAG TPA: hypothetical protein VGH91_10720 [Gammaproteobacteria bacterium]|jgi:hypothetical protein